MWTRTGSWRERVEKSISHRLRVSGDESEEALARERAAESEDDEHDELVDVVPGQRAVRLASRGARGVRTEGLEKWGWERGGPIG